MQSKNFYIGSHFSVPILKSVVTVTKVYTVSRILEYQLFAVAPSCLSQSMQALDDGMSDILGILRCN
jgi:hypothetical protein